MCEPHQTFISCKGAPGEPYDEDLESLLAAMPEEAANKVHTGLSRVSQEYGKLAPASHQALIRLATIVILPCTWH